MAKGGLWYVQRVLAPWRELDGCLRNKWWQLVPMGGLIRTAPAEVRDLSRGFYGAGCPHVGVECFVGQVNKLLMHYGCKSNNGLKLRLSLECLIVELGISAQPLQESFSRYGKWATWSWLTSLWEKCDKFDVRVEFSDVAISLPREGDQWIMRLFAALGFSRAELERLNRVHLYH